MKRDILRVLIAVCFSAALFAQVSSSVGIRGTVSFNSKPAAGVHVVYNRVSDIAFGSAGRTVVVGPYKNGDSLTDSNGGFLIADLIPGRYYVCALPRSVGELGSCEWGTPPAFVVLEGNSVVDVGTLQIRDGRIVTVEVSDPNKRLKTTKALSIGVISALGYYTAPKTIEIKADSSMHRFSLPYDVDLRLFVGSEVDMVDETGFQVAKLAPSISFKLAKDDTSERTIRLTVR